MKMKKDLCRINTIIIYASDLKKVIISLRNQLIYAVTESKQAALNSKLVREMNSFHFYDASLRLQIN